MALLPTLIPGVAALVPVTLALAVTRTLATGLLRTLVLLRRF